jgi:hypothetical protein
MRQKQIRTGLLITILFQVFFSPAVVPAASGEAPNFQAIVGEWVRPDGGYVIHVLKVQEDGTADVRYYNPKPIHVAEAQVILWKGLIKLHIKLQDKGYPGSTYTLYYYAEKDAMAGFYFQAAMGQTYEVVFLRKSNRGA